MDKVLFNFHDIVLILTAFECLLFAALLSATNKKKLTSTYIFVGFLVCHFFVAFHELTFWGKQLRFWLLDISPNLFFIGSYAYFLDGLLLYFFVRALLYKDFAFKSRYLLNLVPLVLYLFYMGVFFYSRDYSLRYNLVETQHIAYSSPHLYFDAVSRYLRVIYGILCVAIVLNYSKELKNVYANVNSNDLAWLKVMLACVLALFAWDAVLVSVKLHGLITNNFDLDLLNIIGLSGYYVTFGVVNALIFLKFTLFRSVAKVNEKYPRPPIDTKAEGVDAALLEHIEQVMATSKVYMQPDITIDRLAADMNMPVKQLSQTIRHHYGRNFFEFINTYRIEEAKRLLSDPACAEKTIIEIFYDVGFNSKSVFNTFFKRVEGVTPSQYRQEQLHKAAAKEPVLNL